MSGSELFLERLTSPDVAAALASGKTTIIVPAGAVEQHGPHLPLLVDAEHGTRLGLEVAQRMGNALVAPTIRIGCSEHHMAFPGTISLERATFKAVLHDYCVSLSRHGFSKICILPSHGGNFRIIREAIAELNDAVGPDCHVVAFTDLMEVVAVWSRVVDEELGLGDRVGGHADIAESSVMMTLAPDLVRPERAAQGYMPEADEAVIDRIIADGLESVTPNGILGDARGMSAELGEKCVTALADTLAEYFNNC
ncbi:MAG: creatininase family protein [Gemmatimonadales bacterium]